ncbi:lamin tail domain-containing protein [Amycolatopsis sp. NPDC059021]|uniref:lamin tail domain-containing protein n=1 Tax=Amycolatopsis sp. NPDC059021 TaxID=3346704 RepID=UPI00366C9E82
MRRLLSGSAALAILATTFLGGGAASATEGTSPEAQPTASTTVVINEISTRGQNGLQDQFIELRNVSPRVVDLTGYVLRVYGPSNNLIDTIALPAGLQLQPRDNLGQYAVLVAKNFSGTIQDQTNVVPFNLMGDQAIPSTGGVALLNQTGVKVDGIGFSMAVTSAREGQPAVPETQATEQKNVANARDVLSTDTDNNRVDFSLHQRTPGADN